MSKQLTNDNIIKTIQEIDHLICNSYENTMSNVNKISITSGWIENKFSIRNIHQSMVIK